MYKLDNIKEEDIEVIYRLFSDSEIVSKIPEDPCTKEEAIEMYEASNEIDLYNGFDGEDEFKLYVLRESSTGKSVGVGLVELWKGDIYIGYRILHEYQGKGLGSFLLKELIDFIFYNSDFTELRTRVSMHNFTSLRVSTKYLDYLELIWDDVDDIYNKIFVVKKRDWEERKNRKEEVLSVRTFGLEIEISDVKRSSIKYPADGYGIDLEEKDVINSNRMRVYPSSTNGCEITTRPLKPTRDDIRELRNFLIQLKELGGTYNWTSGLDMHILASDFSASDLVNFFLCGCHVTMYALEVFNAPKWFEDSGIVPTPSKDVIDKVSKAKDLDTIYEALANSSDKGFYRYPFNIATFYKHKTLEYRFFNSTWNFRELLEMLNFGYKFIDVVKNNPSSIYSIQSKEDFIKFFNLRVELLPKNSYPLIFAGSAGSVRTSPAYIDKAFTISNSRVIRAVVDLTKGFDKIYTVNPYSFQVEVNLLHNKEINKIIICTVSEAVMVFYNIVVNGYRITYKDTYEFLNSYKDGSVLRELQCYWFFQKSYLLVRSTKLGKDVYIERNFNSYKNKIEDTFKSIENYLLLVIDGFNSGRLCLESDYSIWNKIQDDLVIYQQQYEDFGRSSLCSYLAEVSSYKRDFRLVGDNVNFNILPNNLVVISRNPYLNLHKYFVSLNNNYVCVYTNMVDKGGNLLNRSVKNLADISDYVHIPPPDDLVIDNPDDIYIERITENYFNYMRKLYVNKVDLSRDLSNVDTCIAIKYREYVLGVLAFSYRAIRKSAKTYKYSTKLDCDFSCNSNIPLLSKLVILIARTKEVQLMMSRLYKEVVDNCVTKAYTTKPVSMKYRGVFDKVGLVKGGIEYSFKFGSIPSIKDAFEQYKKYLSRRNK